jgi:hypothetical protein
MNVKLNAVDMDLILKSVKWILFYNIGMQKTEIM